SGSPSRLTRSRIYCAGLKYHPARFVSVISRSKVTTGQISRKHSSDICQRPCPQNGTLEQCQVKCRFPERNTPMECSTLKMSRPRGNVPVFHPTQGKPLILIK